MTNSPLISVIVPIYNVAAYLPRCVDSILAQTYKNLEIILVDDGSTDNCLEICQQYAKKDNRIKVIHQENQGVSAARNTGLDNMHGDFVAFVDPDDWVTENALESLWQCQQQTDSDLVIGNFYFTDRETHALAIEEMPNEFSHLEDVFVFILSNHYYGILGKLWRTSFIQNTRFNTAYALAEDADFLFQLLFKKPRVSAISQAVYFYFQRDSSATRTMYSPQWLGYFSIWEQVLYNAQQNKLLRAEPLIFQNALSRACLLGAVFLLNSSPKTASLTPLVPMRNWLKKNWKRIIRRGEIGLPGKGFLLCLMLYPTLLHRILWLPGLHIRFEKHLQKLILARPKTIK